MTNLIIQEFLVVVGGTLDGSDYELLRSRKLKSVSFPFLFFSILNGNQGRVKWSEKHVGRVIVDPHKKIDDSINSII